MKQVFKLAPLAAAVAALTVSGVTVANDHLDEGAHLAKHVEVEKHVAYEGNVDITGQIIVNSLGMAVVNQEQDSDDNYTVNDRVDNDATMGESALRNSRGNIGVNVSAGDNNVQSNAAALAATDAKFVFGSADSEIFMDQNADNNQIMNTGTINTASLAGTSLQNARGNIGVNIASGSSNVQANSFAASVASGSMGEATVDVRQETENNTITNLPEDYQETITLRTRVDVDLEGDYEGQSDQIGDLYLDNWDGADHPGGQNIGHTDVDRFADGAQDLNGDGGAFAFNEAGEVDLAGVITVRDDYMITRYSRHHNDASFGGNALQGARGNIGINITAGSGNLQNNSLAMNKVDALDVVAPPPGGENPSTGE